MEKHRVKLESTERDFLTAFISKGKVSSRKLTRARILLLADEGTDNCGLTDIEIMKALLISESTVTRTRSAFVLEGLEVALFGQKRTKFRLPVLDGKKEARLFAIACSEPPAGRTKWTMQLLADQLIELSIVDTISDETVRLTLKKNEIKPWLKKQWCIPPKENAAFVCAMEDVLTVYHLPYLAEEPLVCFDETSKQLVKETRRSISVQPGKPLRYDFEYERNGVGNIFMMCAPLEGWRHVKVTDRRTMVDWAHCMKDLVDLHFPTARKIRLVMDNLNTHKPASLYETFEPQEARRILDKLDIHYTPKHGSWLNVAEIELSVLQGQCLNRRVPDLDELAKQTMAWEIKRNEKSVGVNWRFTTEEARIKLKKLYPSI